MYSIYNDTMAHSPNPCAADCPANKHCFAETDGVQGCVVGTRRQPTDPLSLRVPRRPPKRVRRSGTAWPYLHDDLGPPCCEVDTDLTFVRTVREISAYAQANAGENPGAQNVRNALHAILSSMPPWDGQRGIFRGDELDSTNTNLSQHQLEDLFQLLERIVPRTGYRVILSIQDLQRQPRERRRKPQNEYWAPDVQRNELPVNSLVLATHLEIHVTGEMAPPEVVNLVLGALRDENVNPGDKYDVTLETEPRRHDPRITYEHITLLRDAMASSLFRGTMDLHFAGDEAVFEDNVEYGDHGRAYANIGDNDIRIETSIDVYDSGIILTIENME